MKLLKLAEVPAQFCLLIGKVHVHLCLLIVVISHKKRKKVAVLCKHLLPVEQVVSGHHAQEACWISDRVELVVELFELLVQQISRLALCLAARTPSGRETRRDTDGMGKTECKVDFYCSSAD